jgi:DNA-binding MarR family transcriptional regulator
MSEEAVEQAVEHLFSELFAAAGEGRRWGDQLTARDGQTQARWQLMWTAAAGSWTVPQIARRLGVSRQNIQRLTNELISEGLVNLDQNPDHKSSPIVRLNSAGQEVLNRINTSAAASNRQIHTSLGAQRINELRTALRDLADLIKQLEQAAATTAPPKK